MRIDMTGGNARQQRVLAAITDEIGRQRATEVHRLDLVALAAAVERSLAKPDSDVDELSREPDHLNASNDI